MVKKLDAVNMKTKVENEAKNSTTNEDKAENSIENKDDSDINLCIGIVKSGNDGIEKS